MDRLESELRHAFERRLGAVQISADLRARLDAAVAARRSRPHSWLAVAASAGLLLVGALAFYIVLGRHSHSQITNRPTAAPSGIASPSSKTVSAATWVEVNPPTAPGARGEASMAYDSARRQVLLFGGDTLSADTWTWDGRNWVKQVVPMSPPARSKAAMAYDAARGEVVLFGGATPGTLLGDTWIWNGSAWIQRHPAATPSPRDGTAMAYDSVHHVIVLFGGHTAAPESRGSGGSSNETWTWNGSDWILLHPTTSPPPRERAAMAFDSSADKIVLFGGTGMIGPQNDTWTWNGSDWALQESPQSPPARYSAGMVHDDATGQIVLFGGLASASVLNDTWTWDGARWMQQPGTTSPPARIAPALAYDAANRTVVLFGGLIIGQGGHVTDFGETWVWATE